MSRQLTFVKRDDQARFLNRIKIMISLDQHEIRPSGGPMTDSVYTRFVADPFRFMMRCDDQTAAAIWRAVVAREMPATEKVQL